MLSIKLIAPTYNRNNTWYRIFVMNTDSLQLSGYSSANSYVVELYTHILEITTSVCHIVYFAGIMWAVHKTKCKRDIQWL
jgi:hypothetical protein